MAWPTRNWLNGKALKYESLKAHTRKIEKQADQLARLYTELEDSNAGTMALYQQIDDRNKALREANDRLRELTRLKSQFLANMSHELRTPLNSIIGFTGIILQGIVGELNDEQRKELTMVYESAKHLLGLINDILDLSKIEAGKIEIVPAVFELEAADSNGRKDDLAPGGRKGTDASGGLSRGSAGNPVS